MADSHKLEVLCKQRMAELQTKQWEAEMRNNILDQVLGQVAHARLIKFNRRKVLDSDEED
uniref:Uncharacterized protein n=1 Tax=Salvator merianae TaxID=96440 RepID=A0A8D0E6X0_SALMN